MSFRSRRRELLSGMGAVGLGGLSGCLEGITQFGTRDVNTRDGDRTLKLGVMAPTSGDLGPVGQAIERSARLPVAQLEAEDVPFEFDVASKDTETSAATGVQRAAELVNDGYPAVNGASSSGVTIQATKQVTIPYRTVSCSPASTSPTITSLNDVGLVFRTVASDSLQSTVLADIAANQHGHTSAATLYTNNDYGLRLSQAFARAFTNDHGGTVSAQVPVDEGKSSYVAEIEAARTGDPDLLILIVYPETGATLLQDFYDADGAEDILVPDALRDGDLPASVGEPLDNIRGTAPVAAGPGKEYFEQAYEAEYEESPGIYNSNSYDATAMLLLANAYAGANEGTAIRSAMYRIANPDGKVITPETLADGLQRAAEGENIEYQGASSAVDFDDNGDMTDATYEYWEFDESESGGIGTIDRVTT